MPKTKEQIKEYNQEYSKRPEVIERARIRNQAFREKRKAYKKTTLGREAENKYRRANYHKIRKEKRLKERYGMSLDDYHLMSLRQNGVCAICKCAPKTPLHVDHCHTTGRVRGLLCGSCNRALGLLKDNCKFLENAITYLIER